MLLAQLYVSVFLRKDRKQRTAVMLSTLLGAISLSSLSKCHKICLTCVLPPAIASSSRNTDGKTPSSRDFILFSFLTSLFLWFQDYLSIKLFVPHWKTDIQWSHGGTTYDSEYRNNQCWNVDTRYNPWHGIPHWTK